MSHWTTFICHIVPPSELEYLTDRIWVEICLWKLMEYNIKYLGFHPHPHPIHCGFVEDLLLCSNDNSCAKHATGKSKPDWSKLSWRVSWIWNALWSLNSPRLSYSSSTILQFLRHRLHSKATPTVANYYVIPCKLCWQHRPEALTAKSEKEGNFSEVASLGFTSPGAGG